MQNICSECINGKSINQTYNTEYMKKRLIFAYIICTLNKDISTG